MHNKVRTIFLLFSNKIAIFILGVVVGYALSMDIINLAKSIFTSEPDTDIVISEPDIDPLANVKLPYNKRIDSRIQYYLHPARKADLFDSYKRSGRYLPMIHAIFEEYNLPKFLVFLPILESRFIPNSHSNKGAVGLWQIMPVTASDYGLKYNRWIDERRDPEKSTIVAAEYLQFLYDKFGNWEMTLAAYNYGYGKLKRAMRRDKTSNFWKLRRIPKETYNFIPNYYAILHILANSQKYGVTLPEKNEPLDYETIEIEATFSIDQIARLANISKSIIKRFNPALTGNIAPSGKYSIKVPIGVKAQFLKQYKETPLDRVEITYQTYRVKRGDTLTKIAKRFGTTVNAIKSDNNLRSSRWIKAGMNLRIASVTVTKQSAPDELERELAIGDRDSIDTSNKINLVYRVERDDLSIKTLARYYAVTVNEIKGWNPWIQSDKLQEGEEISIYKSTHAITLHKTRRGDSLWRLARRYNTTVSNLQRWNQIQGSKIYPGVSLIVIL